MAASQFKPISSNRLHPGFGQEVLLKIDTGTTDPVQPGPEAWMRFLVPFQMLPTQRYQPTLRLQLDLLNLDQRQKCGCIYLALTSLIQRTVTGTPQA